MSQNQCEHIRPDGARCQAPLQTGRSFCFFHDPEQQENRAAARRNGGFMRDHLSRLPRQAVEAYRTPSRTDAPAPLPADVPYLYVRTRDDVTDRLEEILNRPLETQQDRDRARVQLYALSIQSAKLAAEERKEREAARSAERAAIRAERAAERAAREAYTKEAIARQVEAAVERAVQQALAKAAGSSAQASGFNSQSRFSGTDENSPPFQRREKVKDEQFHSAEGTRAAQQSAPKEEPIMIDASKPWDLSQFGGKKPRISCVVPVFTSMRTGKIIDVNEPNPLDPPEHMLRDEFRRKPAASTPAVPEAGAAAAAAQSRFSGTDENSPPFQRREGEIREENFLAAAGPRGAERSATHKTAEPETRERATANGDKPDPEPKDAKPKKDPNNPYSITTLLPDPPRPFESKPRDPCTDPPETPPPPKPKPGPRLHPWIEYWGLH